MKILKTFNLYDIFFKSTEHQKSGEIFHYFLKICENMLYAEAKDAKIW